MRDSPPSRPQKEELEESLRMWHSSAESPLRAAMPKSGIKKEATTEMIDKAEQTR